MKKITDGFIMLDRFGDFRTACWVLYCNGEGAVVEMPPHNNNEPAPYNMALDFFQRNQIVPKYAFLSHSHWDHSCSLPLFRITFSDTKFVTHSSFLKDSYIKYLATQSEDETFFDQIFNGLYWKGLIGGQPVYLIYAPKHSQSDLMILFRGAMITGDWYIGDLKDCNNLVSPGVKIKSINSLRKIIKKLNYDVKMLFSAHGDSFFYNIDFDKIMEETQIDHGDKVVNLPANYLTDEDIEPIIV